MTIFFLYDVNDFLKMKNEDILKENNGKKFDICLMNPPYEKGLHLSFLKKVGEISNKVISIQPCNWLFLKSKQKRTKEVRELVNKYYSEIEVLDQSSKVFGDIEQKSQMSINYIDINKEDSIIKIDGLRNNHSTSEYTSIDDVRLFGKNKIWENLYQKLVIDTKDKLESHAYVYKDLPGIIAYFQKVGHVVDRDDVEKFNGKYVINHGSMSGNLNPDGTKSNDFYTFLGKKSIFINPQKFEDVKDKLKIFYVFDTKEEAQHFIDYTKTDFARSIMYMNKLSKESIIFDQYVPWQDFTQYWDDEKLFKKYNITIEEQKAIKEVLPDYYNIR